MRRFNWNNEGSNVEQKVYVDDIVITSKPPSRTDDFGNLMIGE